MQKQILIVKKLGIVAALALFALDQTAPATAQTVPQSCAPDRPAAVIQASAPDMPEIARQQGASGQVVIEVAVDQGGQLADAAVLQSSGNPYLDKEALRVAQTAAYAPEIRDCQPAAGQYKVVVDFSQ